MKPGLAHMFATVLGLLNGSLGDPMIGEPDCPNEVVCSAGCEVAWPKRFFWASILWASVFCGLKVVDACWEVEDAGMLKRGDGF